MIVWPGAEKPEKSHDRVHVAALFGRSIWTLFMGVKLAPTKRLAQDTPKSMQVFYQKGTEI
jgi:hypothetical protein